jgi:uncharacterized protein YbjT (DUF2867 family)
MLVIGATGRQGGAVVRHLARQGFRVRAMTRDPGKPDAKALTDPGVEVAKGDLDDRASLERAMQDAYGVYSVQDWRGGAQREIEQGCRVADVAKSSGVQHLVYSSVVSADRETGLPHFESKWAIEQHIRDIGLPFTILRPVFFMENWETAYADSIRGGILPTPLDPTCRLQQIATDDIGAVAAAAFGQPDQYMGQTLELAGDDLDMLQTAFALGNALGGHVEYAQISWADYERAAGQELTRMYRWFNDVGYSVDIAALRVGFPFLKTLEQFLAEQEWIKAGPKAGTVAPTG